MTPSYEQQKQPAVDAKQAYLEEMEPILALIKKNCSFDFADLRGYIELHNQKQLLGVSGSIHLEDGNFIRFYVQNGQFDYMTADEDLIRKFKQKLEIQIRILIELNNRKEELNTRYFERMNPSVSVTV